MFPNVESHLYFYNPAHLKKNQSKINKRPTFMIMICILLNSATKSFENSFALSLNTYITIHQLTFSFESGKKMSQKKFDGTFPINIYMTS